MTRRIYIIAGEASGDYLGAEILKLLNNNKNIEVSGIGGELMKKQNLNSLFDYNELAVMGIDDVLKKYSKLKQLIKLTVKDIKKFNPDIVITIDAQGFSKQVAKKISIDTHKMHVVAPTVWAWREGRVKTYAKIFDSLMCLFPFEPKLFKDIKVKFVGHPSCDKPTEKVIDVSEKYGVEKGATIIGLLAGSRTGEIKRCLSIYIEALQKIDDDIHIFSPVVKSQKKRVELALKKSGLKYSIIKTEDKDNALKNCNLVIATIGTATLELGVLGVPMVVGYKVGLLTKIVIALTYKLNHMALPNIILGDKTIVPEFFQENMTKDNIFTAVKSVLADKGKQQKIELKNIYKKLHSPNDSFAKGVVLEIEKILK